MSGSILSSLAKLIMENQNIQNIDFEIEKMHVYYFQQVTERLSRFPQIILCNS
jgi:hypothetical protein